MIKKVFKSSLHLIIICSVFVVSCNKNNSNTDKIDSDINIRMYEELSDNNTDLLFYCYTDQQYACCNFGISHNIKKTSTGFIINFNKINIHDVCLTSPGPATCHINFGEIPNGTYNLEIKVKNKKSSGQLIVTGDYYKIVLNKCKKLRFENKIVERNSKNII